MRLIPIGICAMAAYAVLAFGAVDPSSEFILEIGSVGLLLLWFLRAVRQPQLELEIRSNWLYLPFLGFCVVALAQYGMGLTANAYGTKVELLKLGSYLFLGFVAVQSIQTEAAHNRFAWFLATMAFTVSLFGILQFLTWNGKLYWVREVTNAGTSFGPFVDRDHFAGFVELTVPFALAMLLGGTVRREFVPVASLFGILPIAAVVLSGSRGGMVGVFFEIGVLRMLLGRRVVAGGKRVSGVFLLVLCGIFIAWLGTGGTLQRFKDLTASGVIPDRRVSMYKDTWRIFTDHRWVGSGLGTLQHVYPRYESHYDGYIVDHAHNDYLELLADTGVAGGMCGIFFILVLFRQGLLNLSKAPSPGGGAFYDGAWAACAGFLLHSLVDFNLHIPSNALLFFLIAFTASVPTGTTKASSFARAGTIKSISGETREQSLT